MSERSDANRRLAELFAAPGPGRTDPARTEAPRPGAGMRFSYLFFSDVRRDVSDRAKYGFARELVEFADQTGFEAVYFPERHFGEFGSIYANCSVMAAYLAPLTTRVRLRSAAVTCTLHHPLAIVEAWAMIDVLSGGRVDLGFGNGWNETDFVLSPETYANRQALRNERIPLIQRLWRGESVPFPGPSGAMLPITVYPRPIQPELQVWYLTLSDDGFEHAGTHGYNVFTMLYGIDLAALGKKVEIYRRARAAAGRDPATGTVSLMLHTLVHPDLEWVQRMVSAPFKKYIRSSLIPHMKADGRAVDEREIEKMVDYSFARYFQRAGLFGPVEACREQVALARSVGVDEIACLQDFGVDYDAVRSARGHLQALVSENLPNRILG